ncbi:MAG: hypothetical protein K8J08_04320 [Thermoanaerobaculia bacterium]|nr:hypothetical protein [Thermoanaerobaculia bacterium]
MIPLAACLGFLAHSVNLSVDAQGSAMDVVWTPIGLVGWTLSLLLWWYILGSDGPTLSGDSSAGEDRRAGSRGPWIAVVLFTLLAAWLRTHQLGLVPPEMTSDHVELLLDALRIHGGFYPVFFANNGGREALQMYLVALAAGPLGMGFNFRALQWVSAIEGVLLVPATYWMSLQVVGGATARQKATARWVGAVAAGLMAVSYWPLMLSGLGLRILLTPLTVALAMGFLARAMREDRARDYLALGATLGVGLYGYQANRMLPLVVVVVFVAQLFLAVFRRREELLRAAGQALLVLMATLLPITLLFLAGGTPRAYLMVLMAPWFVVLAVVLRSTTLGNRPAARPLGGLLAALALIAAFAVPIYHYSLLQPAAFWARTTSRFLGDLHPINPTSDAPARADGNLTPIFDRTVHGSSPDARTLLDSFLVAGRDAFGMFHIQGDRAWISNVANRPALDPLTGGLLALGLPLWWVWWRRQRDPALVLPLLVLPLMLLPSALALAHPIENPSFTRASGALPPVLLIAALPVGWALSWWTQFRPAPRGEPGRLRGWRQLAAYAALLVTVLAVLALNYERYFTDYRYNYSRHWLPYREIVEPLRVFVESEGALGNAFVVAHPHWLDHRILGAMAGDPTWPNGLLRLGELPIYIARNQGTRHAYDPAKPLFVMFHTDDRETEEQLLLEASEGTLQRIQYRWQTGPTEWSEGQFVTYTVPTSAVRADKSD